MTVSKKLRFEVFKRDHFTCQYCGRKTPEVILELEHIIPVAKGGTNELDNLTTSCFECNRGKGASLLDTVLKDRDIHEETILIAERELQLAEYNYIKKKIRDRENEELKELKSHFVGKFGTSERYYANAEFPVTITRQCLKIMSYMDIFDLIDLAVEITTRDTKGDYHTIAAVKYLTGILKNKLKEKGLLK